jgi:CRP-like cAMP-binding protein
VEAELKNKDPFEIFFTRLEAISPIPPGYRETIRDLFQIQSIEKGGFYIRKGDKEERLSFVVSGLFRYYYIDQEGRERIKMFTPEGNFLVSYTSLVTGEESPYYVDALEQSTILTINRQNYIQGFTHDPYWIQVERMYVQQMLIQKVRREASLLTEDSAHRYENFVENHLELHNRLRLKDIAAFLGMTDVTLSRIRKNR